VPARGATWTQVAGPVSRHGPHAHRRPPPSRTGDGPQRGLASTAEPPGRLLAGRPSARTRRYPSRCGVGRSPGCRRSRTGSPRRAAYS
jgi:hypothetical protein